MCLAVMAAWGEGWDELSLEGWVGFAKASVAGRWGKPWFGIVNEPGTGVKHLGESQVLVREEEDETSQGPKGGRGYLPMGSFQEGYG